jgi:hypothetical protein
MWSDIQGKMAEILSSRLFPVLITDTGYAILLRNAGIVALPQDRDGNVDRSFYQAQSDWGKSIPFHSQIKIHASVKRLSPAERDKLLNAAQVCVSMLLLEVQGKGSLFENDARALGLEGTRKLYRLWDSTDRNRTRHWWFSEQLLRTAALECKSSKMKVKDWLRDKLAISFNFGKCDRFSEMVLCISEALPAIEAKGLSMPQYASWQTDANKNQVHLAYPDYWKKYGQRFQGNEYQYFLPFVPPDRIRDARMPWDQ